MDYSLPGSSVHGIFQARILEWVAISFSMPHTLNGVKIAVKLAGHQPFQESRGNGWSCFPATLLQRGGQLLCSVTLQASYSEGIGPDPPTDPQRQNSEGSQKGGKKELPSGIVCYFMAGSQDIHVGGFSRSPHLQPLYGWTSYGAKWRKGLEQILYFS